MPEGPSIAILREELAPFVGRIVKEVSGSSKLDLQRMRGKKIVALRSWGKHFLICFPKFTLRIHLLMFGSHRVNEIKLQTMRDPDPSKWRRVPTDRPAVPRVSFTFDSGDVLNFYSCALRFVEGDLDDTYDWAADVLSDDWNPRAARRKLKLRPKTIAADALLDQTVFAGVGNIIKNEVLFRTRVHPQTTIGALPPRKLGEVIKQAREYSFDFYHWRKAGVLKRNLLAHTKKTCPRCHIALQFRASLGRAKRRTFFCKRCQVRYRAAP